MPSDQLSHPETLSFWQRYFYDGPSSSIRINDFTSALIQEYQISLIKPTVKKLAAGEDQQAAVNMDVLIDDLRQEIAKKVSID